MTTSKIPTIESLFLGGHRNLKDDILHNSTTYKQKMATTTSPPILADLMVGFEALTRRVEELVAKNSALEKQLQAYTQQVSQEQHLLYLA